MAVVLAAVGTIVLVFVGYRRVSNAPEMLLSSIKDGANLSLGKIRQTSTRNGKKEWSLEADSAHYIETESKAVLKNLFVTYFLEDTREVYLHADQGIMHTDTNDIEFSGNVVIRNEEYQLRTERLSYEHGRRFIFSNDPVHISGDDSELSAASITYDLKANKVVLTGNVAATISRDFATFQGAEKR
jgi:LPS export ABC transporter protein LptC